MTVYHGVVASDKSVDNVVHCDCLEEFFAEFIKYRKGKAQTDNFSKNAFPFGDKGKKYSTDDHGKIFYLDLDFDTTFNRENKHPIVYGDNYEFDYSTGGDLGLNISILKIKRDCLNDSEGSQQRDKIEKVLQDIGTTGEIKDTYGLDLNGPQVKENLLENNQPQTKTEKPREKSNRETANTKSASQQSDKKVYGIVGSLVAVSVLGLIVWLVLKKKNQKKNKPAA